MPFSGLSTESTKIALRAELTRLGRPHRLDKTNVQEHGYSIKLTNREYSTCRNFDAKGRYDGTYTLSVASEPGLWYYQVTGEPWDLTAGSFEDAKTVYYEFKRRTDAARRDYSKRKAKEHREARKRRRAENATTQQPYYDAHVQQLDVAETLQTMQQHASELQA